VPQGSAGVMGRCGDLSKVWALLGCPDTLYLMFVTLIWGRYSHPRPVPVAHTLRLPQRAGRPGIHQNLIHTQHMYDTLSTRIRFVMTHSSKHAGMDHCLVLLSRCSSPVRRNRYWILPQYSNQITSCGGGDERGNNKKRQSLG